MFVFPNKVKTYEIKLHTKVHLLYNVTRTGTRTNIEMFPNAVSQARRQPLPALNLKEQATSIGRLPPTGYTASSLYWLVAAVIVVAVAFINGHHRPLHTSKRRSDSSVVYTGSPQSRVRQCALRTLLQIRWSVTIAAAGRRMWKAAREISLAL